MWTMFTLFRLAFILNSIMYMQSQIIVKKMPQLSGPGTKRSMMKFLGLHQTCAQNQISVMIVGSHQPKKKRRVGYKESTFHKGKTQERSHTERRDTEMTSEDLPSNTNSPRRLLMCWLHLAQERAEETHVGLPCVQEI